MCTDGHGQKAKGQRHKETRRTKLLEHQRLTTNSAAADGQAADRGGGSRNRGESLADTTTARDRGRNQGRRAEHGRVGDGHGSQTLRGHGGRGLGGQEGRGHGGSGEAKARERRLSRVHELVHSGTLLGAVGSAEIHNVLLAEQAPVRVHF